MEWKEERLLLTAQITEKNQEIGRLEERVDRKCKEVKGLKAKLGIEEN